jgi:hypothetical protein
MLDWKGFGRKTSWSNLRYCYVISLDGLRKTTKSLRVAGLQDEN